MVLQVTGFRISALDKCHEKKCNENRSAHEVSSRSCFVVVERRTNGQISSWCKTPGFQVGNRIAGMRRRFDKSRPCVRQVYEGSNPAPPTCLQRLSVFVQDQHSREDRKVSRSPHFGAPCPEAVLAQEDPAPRGARSARSEAEQGFCQRKFAFGRPFTTCPEVTARRADFFRIPQGLFGHHRKNRRRNMPPQPSAGFGKAFFT